MNSVLVEFKRKEEHKTEEREGTQHRESLEDVITAGKVTVTDLLSSGPREVSSKAESESARQRLALCWVFPFQR